MTPQEYLADAYLLMMRIPDRKVWVCSSRSEFKVMWQNAQWLKEKGFIELEVAPSDRAPNGDWYYIVCTESGEMFAKFLLL